MKNKRFLICLLAVLLAALTGAQALGETSFPGKVISRETLAISAPFGGLIRVKIMETSMALHSSDAANIVLKKEA